MRNKINNVRFFSKHRSGFTLIELSIVLIIIGLIVSGVFVGKHLIEAAENRAIIHDIEQFKNAFYTFYSKYDHIPGDIPNATSFFSGCVDDGGNLCNGDGDKLIEYGNYEAIRVWQHLSLAGMVKGSYTGLIADLPTIGLTSPLAGLGGGFYSFYYHPTTMYGVSDSDFRLGSIFDNAWAIDSLVTAQRAWNIDKKMDDGEASTGYVHTLRGWSIWNTGGTCVTGTYAAAAGASDYILTDSDKSCSMYFKFDIE